MSGTFAVRRKGTKRARPWDLTARDIKGVSSPQAEDIQETKRQRPEKPFPTTTDEATSKNTSHATTVALPSPSPDAAAVDNVDPNSVRDTQPNAGATGRWTLEEDAKLNFAVTNTCKKKRGNEHRKDWVAIAALVPGRTKKQCNNRWHDTQIDPPTARGCKWTADEDKKLKDAVRVHGGKNWERIAALVPGRTKLQCSSRWHHALVYSIDPMTVRAGKWTADEDKQLKDVVRAHGGKNWGGIAALVPGRTKRQCVSRWHATLVSNMDPTTAHAGKWTADEDNKLLDAVRAHGAYNWGAIAALVPGRTRGQCCDRWHATLDPSIDPATARAGQWTADEDKKLKDAVPTHGGKNWESIAALVPGRTKKQCYNRWHDNLDPSIGWATARTGKWTADEDKKLKDAVPTQDDKNWETIALLVPGRTKIQCRKRWHDTLDPSIGWATARTGKWTAAEDKMLKDAVLAHGGKNWKEIATLVPGRTKMQCRNRWCDALVSNIDPATARAGKWTADEDKILKDAVATHGANNWEEITALVPGRTKKQCRDRWYIYLDPNRSTAREKEYGTLNKKAILGQDPPFP
jgi:hypothetical protein